MVTNGGAAVHHEVFLSNALHLPKVLALAFFLNGSLAGCVFGKKPGKGLPVGRVVVAAEDYRLQVTDSEAPVLQSSMLTRRQKAWEIVREAFRPVTVVTGDQQASQNFGAKNNEQIQSVTVPLWTTWYSSEDFSIVYKAFLNRVEGDPSGPAWGQARTLAAVDDIMQKYRTRKIVLSQRAVSEQLRQFNHESSAERAARLQDAAVGRGGDVVFTRPDPPLSAQSQAGA